MQVEKFGKRLVLRCYEISLQFNNSNSTVSYYTPHKLAGRGATVVACMYVCVDLGVCTGVGESVRYVNRNLWSVLILGSITQSNAIREIRLGEDTVKAIRYTLHDIISNSELLCAPLVHPPLLETPFGLENH